MEEIYITIFVDLVINTKLINIRMDTKTWNKFSAAYFLICLLDILAIQMSQYAYLELVFKPLIMLSIIGFTYLYLKSFNYYKWILFAFVFSWLGDVFLLGQSKHDLFFVAGLASFLIAHLLYAAYFMKSVNYIWNKSRVIRVLQFLLVLFVIAYYCLMYRGLLNLALPVLFYVSTIGAMAILALNRFSICSNNAFWFTFIGAMLFVLSDSIIGYNKFVEAIPYAHLYIMLLYCAAQYLILRGFCWERGEIN
jgi:uncharacterized membrane protein YhhN